ncbi:MAG: DNA alkylation repair protein [Nanoarchaeota archaeon]|nr:DNA alkylation repair protein [Nanoarchaeota archaeon]
MNPIDDIIKELKKLSVPNRKADFLRFGINIDNALFIQMPVLRDIAKSVGKNHKLVEDLWNTGIHEARIIACLIDEPDKVTEKQMEKWVKDFNSWDICDQCCNNLFRKTRFAHQKAVEWSSREEEFVKRAGFVMMAVLAVHDKKSEDNVFLKFLEIAKKESTDERNFVKKAVNWAIRQIGKRNELLNQKATAICHQIEKKDSKSSKWIAKDALRELNSEEVKKRLHI